MPIAPCFKARGYRHAHKWDESATFVPSIYNYYNNGNSYCHSYPTPDDIITILRRSEDPAESPGYTQRKAGRILGLTGPVVHRIYTAMLQSVSDPLASLAYGMDPGARLGLGGGARACRLDSFFGFLVLPGLVDLIRFAVFAKNRTSGRHRLSPPGFV